MAPGEWNGSVAIYRKIISPIFLKHQKKIDTGIEKAAEYGKALYDEGKS